MTDQIPVALRYGELGVLVLVLVGGFVLLRSMAERVAKSLDEHTVAMRQVATSLAEGEGRAVLRHTETREMMRQIIREELASFMVAIQSVRALDEQVRDRIESTGRELARDLQQTRHDLRNAMQATGGQVCDFVDLALEPLKIQGLGHARPTPRPFRAVRPPTPSRPEVPPESGGSER